jgi:hypothetical protein
VNLTQPEVVAEETVRAFQECPSRGSRSGEGSGAGAEGEDELNETRTKLRDFPLAKGRL